MIGNQRIPACKAGASPSGSGGNSAAAKCEMGERRQIDLIVRVVACGC